MPVPVREGLQEIEVREGAALVPRNRSVWQKRKKSAFSRGVQYALSDGVISLLLLETLVMMLPYRYCAGSRSLPPLQSCAGIEFRRNSSLVVIAALRDYSACNMRR